MSQVVIPFPFNVAFTELEREFKAGPAVKFAAENWPFAIAVVVIYLMGIQIGTRFMSRCEKPFDLKYLLAFWNLFLCVFSFIGMVNTVPALFTIIATQPYADTVCSDGEHTWGSGKTGFWVMLFIFSKIPELIDTLFIVLRRKPLIFLHWYHHVTVLLFCWSAYSTMAGSGLYFVAMNYSVHALMYGYFFLQTLHMVPKWFPTFLITLSQIVQMFVGTFVCASCWYYHVNGRTCHNDLNNLIAGAVMYGSYLYLFSDFAVRRYILAPKKAKTVKKID
eukprot:Colp12_sorted_trinity150504_noHs@13318